MQLELAFLERPVAPAARMEGPWDQIDPQAPDRSAGHPLASHRADARGRLNAGDKR